ncbi:MAG: hypothetical protein K6C69_08470 [Lachnospiraceae bacterium]|nr:hypothetical protein [Lachnospiraceae bacterium]
MSLLLLRFWIFFLLPIACILVLIPSGIEERKKYRMEEYLKTHSEEQAMKEIRKSYIRYSGMILLCVIFVIPYILDFPYVLQGEYKEKNVFVKKVYVSRKTYTLITQDGEEYLIQQQMFKPGDYVHMCYLPHIKAACVTKQAMFTDTLSETEREYYESHPAAMIDPVKLWSAEGLTVTVEKYINGGLSSDDRVILHVENLSDKTLSLRLNDLVVNGFASKELDSVEVAPGTSEEAKVLLHTKLLRSIGINEIGEIEFYFSLDEGDCFSPIALSDKCVLKTDLYDDMDQTIDDEGVELYNSDGVRICARVWEGLYSINSHQDSSLLIYVENNSDIEKAVWPNSLMVNGIETSIHGFVEVYPGQKGVINYERITTLDGKEITEIKNIDLNFTIYDEMFYGPVRKDTGVLSLTKE